MSIRLVVGLGNPGEEYADTRHNIGFRVVDEIIRRRGGLCLLGGRSLVAGCDGIVFAKPQTYMNRSGSAVSELLLNSPRRPARKHHWLRKIAALVMNIEKVGPEDHEDSVEIAPQEMLVIVDDVDLPLGRLRLRPRGGPGTHNGLRDIVACAGTDFPRLRVGVRGENIDKDLAEYVLSPFPGDERNRVVRVIERAADAVDMAIADGVAAAMNVFNRPDPQTLAKE
jgi:PTH1 family peptidyl-tRNA hydrolase